MTNPQISLRRLRILSGGKPIYDHPFHSGVNIIHGENGSGKSTIADFIFYIFGGEFDDWKSAAKRCDEVQAEIQARGGTLTLRRPIEGKQTPIHVFFGSMQSAIESGLDNWQKFPIRRQSSSESFSQVLFRSIGIPEARSDEASNITMHQIMRLLYSDQRTPAARLFRFELFDTPKIRRAVGDLLSGAGNYEIYEIELELRALGQDFENVNADLNAMLRAVPPDIPLLSIPNIDTEVQNLIREAATLRVEVDTVDAKEASRDDSTAAFLTARRTLLERINKIKSSMAATETSLQKAELELEEIADFSEYLEGLEQRLSNVEKAADQIGSIEFTHCPSCLTNLSDRATQGQCVVCGSQIDVEEQQSRYLQIRIDLQNQLRESKQLSDSKLLLKQKLGEDRRRGQAEYKELLSEYSTRYDLSNSPRESFLAQRFRRIGQIDKTLERLDELRSLAQRIDDLSAHKDKLSEILSKLRDRRDLLVKSSVIRLTKARELISSLAVNLLAADLPRQDEFQTAHVVELEFDDDAILVDDAINFAESSNVILKNSALLAFWSAACKDSEFFHPRFLLMDNVEDKGMELARSHNFQKLIVEQSDACRQPHQIIFTTSMLNPALDRNDLVVGPLYTKSNRTLQFGN